jgi:hypothetical protein
MKLDLVHQEIAPLLRMKLAAEADPRPILKEMEKKFQFLEQADCKIPEPVKFHMTLNAMPESMSELKTVLVNDCRDMNKLKFETIRKRLEFQFRSAELAENGGNAGSGGAVFVAGANGSGKNKGGKGGKRRGKDYKLSTCI